MQFHQIFSIVRLYRTLLQPFRLACIRSSVIMRMLLLCGFVMYGHLLYRQHTNRKSLRHVHRRLTSTLIYCIRTDVSTLIGSHVGCILQAGGQGQPYLYGMHFVAQRSFLRCFPHTTSWDRLYSYSSSCVTHTHLPPHHSITGDQPGVSDRFSPTSQGVPTLGTLLIGNRMNPVSYSTRACVQ